MRRNVLSGAVIVTFAVALGAPSRVIAEEPKTGGLRIGWGSADITPEGPIVMSGGRRARVSSGVMDPIGVTALVLESVGAGGKTAELVAQVTVEISSVREEVMEFVLKKMGERILEVAPDRLIIYATHTHAAPDSRPAHALAEKLATMLAHRAAQVELTRLRLTDEQLQGYWKSFEKLLVDYLRMSRELEENPERMRKAGWQNEITPVFWNLRQAHRVLAAFEREEPTITVPVHVVRIGDMVMATNPFELYLDYGMRIKARSKAVQTFVVQLSNGTYGYLPTKRSVAGGAYGGIPTSNEVGPVGGQELVERTLELIQSLWEQE